MSDQQSNAMTAIVAILAIVVIVCLGYMFARKYMIAEPQGTTIQLDLPANDPQS